MKNVKGIAIATDGSFKRIAMTYDEIDETGKVVNNNVKINRIVTDEAVLKSIAQVEEYAKSIVDIG